MTSGTHLRVLLAFFASLNPWRRYRFSCLGFWFVPAFTSGENPVPLGAAVALETKAWEAACLHVENRKRRGQKGNFGVDTDSQTEWVVPVRYLKQVIAVFLIPPAWVLTRAFFSSFSVAAFRHGFWASEEFWFFSLGILLWIIAFFGLPRPMLLYVFGHEFTHALWVWLMGGKVSKFRISKDGGYIVTDTNNFWIALAPYFFPIYSILVLMLYGGIGAFIDVEPYRRWLFGAVGFTWAFHITFTIWMLWRGQTDLIEHGTFFSMMVIYLANFTVLSLMLILASRAVTFGSFGNELLRGAADFSNGCLRLVNLKN